MRVFKDFSHSKNMHGLGMRIMVDEHVLFVALDVDDVV
jgi:hypothetical protein